jgi:hypothetical protein
MANPTTNYGWPMPTSSDLVTDLPADFDAFGQPVDNTLKALNPETTLGDISYRSAVSNTNTRLGIGTAGQVLAVSGGVPAWTTTADVTPLTTKGDLFTFTTEDARIGVGADGTVLTAASGEATGLEWAALPASGGETLITTTEADDTVSSYTFSSLGSYKHLRFVITKLQTTAADNRAIGIQLNADTGGNYTNYSSRDSIGDTEFNSNAIALAYNTDTSARYGQFVLEIWNYGSSTEYKAIRWYSAVYTGGTAYSAYMNGHWNSTAAITSVKFLSGSNIKLGTFKVYGIS